MSVFSAIVARMRWIGAARTTKSAVVFSLVSRVAILLVNVATGIVIARTLGPAGRGAAGAIALWPAVISGLLTLGVPAAVRYEASRRLDKPADLFTSAILISGLLGLLAFVVGFTLVPHLLMQYSTRVAMFAQWMMLFAPLILMNATLQAFYESQGDFKRSNALSFIPPILTLTGLAVLHIVNKTSPYSVALAYEVPFALTTITTLVTLRRFFRFPVRIVERLRSLLHYGIRAYGIDILNTLAGQIDQAMVVGLLSAANFGLYAVAVSASRILYMLAGSLNTVLFPKAANLEPLQAVALVSRSARIIFAATFVASLGFVIVLPFLISIAYGKEYSSIVGITRLLTLAMLFYATTATFTQAFMATGKPAIATILQLVGVGTTVPLMLLLIPKFGITGAAYAAVISNAVRFALVMISYPLFLNHPIPRLLMTRRDIRELFGSLRRAPTS